MRNYEVENKLNSLRNECTAEQVELAEGTVKLAETLDSITMDSIRLILPDKFSEICMDCTDEESMKALTILAKFMGIYKDSVELTRLSAVASAQQGAQLGRIEKKLDELSRKLDYMDTKLDRIVKEKKENK